MVALAQRRASSACPLRGLLLQLVALVCSSASAHHINPIPPREPPSARRVSARRCFASSSSSSSPSSSSHQSSTRLLLCSCPGQLHSVPDAPAGFDSIYPGILLRCPLAAIHPSVRRFIRFNSPQRELRRSWRRTSEWSSRARLSTSTVIHLRLAYAQFADTSATAMRACHPTFRCRPT